MKQTKRLLLSLVAFFACMGIYAQTEITGSVVDETGEGVIGATVKVKGSSHGTVTDFDGNFKLKVQSGAILIFSYIGYDKVEQAAKTGMKVVMKDNAPELQEVVVTGYQVQRKADLTGSVAVMDMKGPKSEGDPNILNSLQGKMPGVNVVTDATPGGEGSKIVIRGMSSINGGNPLYVVDGVATETYPGSLNASDIETMQVLKDASSASIYGSRAANGVVIITTKKGKAGKMAININYNASIQTVAKTYDVMTTEEWGRAYYTATKNDGFPFSSDVYQLNGDQVTPVENVNGYAVANTDWQDQVYSSAWSHNLAASISNATEKGSYLFSGNYVKQDGLINDTYYKRFSGRVNTTYDFSKYVSVGENLMVTYWEDQGAGTNGERGIPFSAMRQHPALPVYSSTGAFGDSKAMLNSDIDNPVQTLYNARDNSNHHWRIFGNAYIDLKPLKGLVLKSNLGIEHLQGFSKSLTRKVRETDATKTRAVNRGYLESNTWTWTNTANYMFDIAGQHHFTILAGTEAIKTVIEDLSAWRNDYKFEDADFMQIGAGDGTMTNGGGREEEALFSLFGKIDYNFADRYLFSATLRRDQSSRLAKDNNSGIFPAFSGAWRVSEESFWPKNNIVSDVKVRLAWGQNGNATNLPGRYPTYTTYITELGNSAYALNGDNKLVPGVKKSTTGNPDLKWETTTQTNLGIDAYLFGGSVNVAFDYFWKKTKDMITPITLPATAGESAVINMNTGEMKNHGFELNVGYRSPQYGDFSWDGNLNASMYRNELIKLNDDKKYQGEEIRLIEGQPMGVYWGWVYDGIFQNEEEVANHAQQAGKGVGRMKFRDLNGDDVINDDDRCIIGDPNPDFSLGLSLNFKYKDWQLSTFFTGDFGFDIYNVTRKQLEFMTYGNTYTNRSKDLLDAWSPTNTGAEIPSLTTVPTGNETRLSNYFVEDGSYFKCKYVKISYNFNHSWMKTVGVQALNLYGQVDNLFTITGYKGLDPEVPMGGWGERLDSGPYPRARTFSVGLNLTF